MRACSIDGCERPRFGRGWCRTHYQRWYASGDPGEAKIRKYVHGISEIERFQSYVDTSGGPDACHLWTGSLQNGYGQFSFNGRMRRAARWLLGHMRGEPLRQDEDACHHCDNPPCVNPAHLYVGTRQENVRDMFQRGRARPRGIPYRVS